MPRGKTITLEGKVLNVPGNGTAEVEIFVAGACSGCQAKSLCSVGKSESRIITAKCDVPLHPGDNVRVEMKLSQGFGALLIGYIIPFIVLVTAFVAALLAGAGELASALISFAAIGCWYLAVWLLRGRIGKKFDFKIKV